MHSYQSLPIHSVDRSGARELAVACPQRIDPVQISTCVSCELCGGLEVDPKSGFVGVRCAVAGEPAPSAPSTPISTIMTENVVSVSADSSVENIRWLLVDRRIGAVPVVDARGALIGIVSQSDILRDTDTFDIDAIPRDALLEDGASERALVGLTASDVMTPVVFVVPEQASIATAAAAMIERRVHHLPVVGAGGEIRGIVSTLDLVRWLAAHARFDR